MTLLRERRRRGTRRAAISEILGALIMLGLTIAAFALIVPGLLNKTQVQASAVIQQYQKGEVKQGQLLSTLYHVEAQDSSCAGTVGAALDCLRIGLYNYGSQNIVIEYAFVTYGTNNTYNNQASTWQLQSCPSGGQSCTSSSSTTICSVSSSSSNTCVIPPGHAVMLEILSEEGGLALLPPNCFLGTTSCAYQLFLYSYASLGYTFEE